MENWLKYVHEKRITRPSAARFSGGVSNRIERSAITSYYDVNSRMGTCFTDCLQIQPSYSSVFVQCTMFLGRGPRYNTVFSIKTTLTVYFVTTPVSPSPSHLIPTVWKRSVRILNLHYSTSTTVLV